MQTYIIIFMIIVLYYSYRFAWWKSPVSFKQTRILMYHMIADKQPGAKFNGLRVSAEMFEKQLAYLVNNEWKFVTMSEFVCSDNTEKKVAITFDDGFEDNYKQAFPLLKKYNARATLYLVVDRHNNDWSTKKNANHNSGELEIEKKLTDMQIKEMVDSGVFELGGHTMTHANLNSLNNEQKIYELTESKKILEQKFNLKIHSFAYPFGIYQPEDVSLVESVGYTNAVTTTAGICKADLGVFELPRIKISGKDNFLAFIIRIRTGMRGLYK